MKEYRLANARTINCSSPRAKRLGKPDTHQADGVKR
jgi:hypothetical protein